MKKYHLLLVLFAGLLFTGAGCEMKTESSTDTSSDSMEQEAIMEEGDKMEKTDDSMMEDGDKMEESEDSMMENKY